MYRFLLAALMLLALVSCGDNAQAPMNDVRPVFGAAAMAGEANVSIDWTGIGDTLCGGWAEFVASDLNPPTAWFDSVCFYIISLDSVMLNNSQPVIGWPCDQPCGDYRTAPCNLGSILGENGQFYVIANWQTWNGSADAWIGPEYRMVIQCPPPPPPGHGKGPQIED